MLNNGTFEGSYEYYIDFLSAVAFALGDDQAKMADACMYAVDLIGLLQSLGLNLPDNVKFDFEKSRLRFEWRQNDDSDVVFIISDEEIRSIVYKNGGELIELNTVVRGMSLESSLAK
jgi:hypothetical protein